MKKFSVVAHTDTAEKTLWKTHVPDIVPLRMLIGDDHSAIVGRAALVWEEGKVTAFCRLDDYFMCNEHGQGAAIPSVTDPPTIYLREEGGTPIEKNGVRFLVGARVTEAVLISQETADIHGGTHGRNTPPPSA